MDLFIISGASAGIGAALAARLAREPHARVVGIARSAGDHVAVRADLSTVEGIDVAAAAVRAAVTGDIDRAVLVNNAATLDPMAVTGSGELDARRTAAALTLNLAAPIVLTDVFAAATRALAARRVVNITSGAAKSTYPGWVVYGASKAGLDHATETAHVELEDVAPPIVITALAPGVVDTAMQSHIRTMDGAHFPRVARFHSLHEGGQLAAAAAVADKIVTALWRLPAGILSIDQI